MTRIRTAARRVAIPLATSAPRSTGTRCAQRHRLQPRRGPALLAHCWAPPSDALAAAPVGQRWVDGAHGLASRRDGKLRVVTEAFAESVGQDEDAFTAGTTREILDQACYVAGLDPRDARLLRLGEHAMFRLAEPVVVRIARSAAYEPDARREVAVARWLEAEDYPAARVLPIDQPLVIGGRVVTFWKSLGDGEVYGSPAEVASLLARLHSLVPPESLDLKPLRPFARAVRRADRHLADARLHGEERGAGASLRPRRAHPAQGGVRRRQ